MSPPPSHMEDAIRFVIDREIYLRRFTRTDLARALGVPSSTIKRRMEAAPARGLDELVSAASEITGIPPASMWRKALSVWESNGDSPAHWAKLKRTQANLVARIDRSQPGDGNDPTSW
jgi:hypothetical protein